MSTGGASFLFARDVRMYFRMPKYSLPEIKELRAVKTRREVASITKAQRLSEVVLKEAVAKLRVGVSEVSLARLIVASLKRKGVKALAFEPIVAFGKNTAEIHHWATSARLKPGDLVMLDFGATVNGYCSDMTRTFIFGTPTARQKKVYASVLSAQEKVLLALGRGERRAAVLDSLARTFLGRAFGTTAFPHGLGHGVGTAIHEWPNLKPASPDVLRPGMVVTVEPAMYVKGWGGVRIEDMVLVTPRGTTNLTRAPKPLSAVTIRP
jgi:Xaa-Pro aminopeptidase